MSLFFEPNTLNPSALLTVTMQSGSKTLSTDRSVLFQSEGASESVLRLVGHHTYNFCPVGLDWDP